MKVAEAGSGSHQRTTPAGRASAGARITGQPPEQIRDTSDLQSNWRSTPKTGRQRSVPGDRAMSLPYEVLIAQPNGSDKIMFAVEFLSNPISAALIAAGLSPVRSSLDSTHR